jgi:hypothetical protein
MRVTFRRPALTINVALSKSVGESVDNEITRILEATKNYVTTDNMDRIGLYMGWGPGIWSVNLEITNFYGNTRIAKYTADYYINNAYDDSPENIDGYKTWRTG